MRTNSRNIMISQKCPRCRSKRIRRGYRATPIFSKLVFRFNLLCDSCNWEFTGFAIPWINGPKRAKHSVKSPKVSSVDDN